MSTHFALIRFKGNRLNEMLTETNAELVDKVPDIVFVKVKFSFYIFPPNHV